MIRLKNIVISAGVIGLILPVLIWAATKFIAKSKIAFKISLMLWPTVIINLPASSEENFNFPLLVSILLNAVFYMCIAWGLAKGRNKPIIFILTAMILILVWVLLLNL